MIRLAIPLIVLAAPVAAQTATLGLPPACTAFVTVQTADCSVTHYLTCSGDPVGQKYKVSMYSTGGDSISVLDDEAQWLLTADAYSQTVETLIPDSANPSLISELLATSTDSFDFATIGQDGTITRFRGRERLTGGEVTIDDVPLLVAELQMQAIDESGEQLWSSIGTEYISADWRLYFGGPTNWTTPTESYPSDGSPVSFDFPGDPGFLTSVPAFGCTG